MDIPADLFTKESLFTLQGAALACVLVPNVLGKIIRIHPNVRALLALIIGTGLQLLAAKATPSHDNMTWVVAVLNGFLVAGAALGVASTAPPAAQLAGRWQKKFWCRWT